MTFYSDSFRCGKTYWNTGEISSKTQHFIPLKTKSRLLYL